MLKEIIRFAKSDGHGSRVMVVIFAHGNSNGWICGDDVGGPRCASSCTEQDVIDAVNQPELESVPKVKIICSIFEIKFAKKSRRI